MSTSTVARPAPAPTTIQTPRQFADELVRDVATQNDLTYTEVRTELHTGYIEDSWWNYATAAFASGANFSRTTWRALEPWQRTVILRSPRAQRDVRRVLLESAPIIPRLPVGAPLTWHYRTPEAEALFDAMWRGERDGTSEAALRFRLAEHEADLEAVRAGRMAPHKIIGMGYKKPKAVAIQWLSDQIAKKSEALATRGRSDSVNRSNVYHHLAKSF